MIKICISVTSHALDPFPPSQTVTPCRTPSPWSVTYFMDGPQHSFYLGLHYTHFLSIQVLPGASIMGKLGSRLPDFGQGGREILLYLIMYRKYVRKWWFLKRNNLSRSSCKWPIFAGKIGNFCEIVSKIEIFREIFLENDFFQPGSTTPHARSQTRLKPLSST